MPRRRDAPNGFTAWLITETVSWARGQGHTHVSLNFSPFAGLLAAKAELPRRQRLQRRALLRLKGILTLQLDNLLRFNAQFDPVWQPRYVILQAWTDLPRVAVAAMAAEGYLPHAALIRGRGWTPGTVQTAIVEPHAAEPPAVELPAAEEPAGGPPAAEVPVGGRLVGGIPAGGAPADGRPGGGIPASGAPASGAPADGAPADGRPGGGIPAGGAPAGGQPAAGGSAAGRPEAAEAAAAARGEVPAGRGHPGRR
jgi:hypothetical protein